MKNNTIRDLLYKSFDVELTSKEQVLLNEELKNNGSLMQEKKEVEEMRSLLSGCKNYMFGEDFVDSFVENLELKTNFANVNELWEELLHYFKPVAIAVSCAILILSFLNFGTFQNSLSFKESTVSELYEEETMDLIEELL